MSLRAAIILLAFAIFGGAQTQVKQGEVLRITTQGSTAQLNDKTIRLFAQPDGNRLGLLPIPVMVSPANTK